MYFLFKQKITRKLVTTVFRSSRTRFESYFSFFFAIDRDRTVLRRSKPSSRTTLIGEQPNPWNFIHLQDVMSRHRGAKRLLQYELSRDISLLSLAYLLFVDRCIFHSMCTGSLWQNNVFT
jgi:hypothetical protein